MPRFSSVFDPRLVLVLLARAFVKVDLFGGAQCRSVLLVQVSVMLTPLPYSTRE